MNKNFIIRKANIKDVPEFVLHFKQIMAQHSRYDQRFNKLKKDAEKRYEKYIRKRIKSRSPNSVIFVAEYKAKVIGHLICKIEKRAPIYIFEKMGSPETVFVKKEFRNLGIGRKLMDKANEWFKSKNLHYAYLQVHLKNKNALVLYEKFGFVKERYVMYKKL